MIEAPCARAQKRSTAGEFAIKIRFAATYSHFVQLREIPVPASQTLINRVLLTNDDGIDAPGLAALEAVAAEIARAPYRRASRTSISGGLRFAKPLFDNSGYKGLRRVIDVSGDGANNAGPLVELTRDDVLAAGITINGLPIMLKRPYTGTMDIENLDEYYEDCVIGGPGAFVIPIREREKFIEATRTKLVLEIAGRQPEGRVIPASSQAPRVSCTIGEKMWQERWGGGIDFR